MKALLEYGFKKAGLIIKGDDSKNKINFELNLNFKDEKVSQVYAWVINEEIKYIGMAGNGLRVRLNQHKSGWRGGSNTGRKIANNILLEFKKGNDILIYAYTSGSTEKNIDIFKTKINIGFHKMTYMRLEEAYLIENFKKTNDLWNISGASKQLNNVTLK